MDANKEQNNSRRIFTNSLIGAVTALPFLSVLSNGQQKATSAQDVEQEVQKLRITHDTPPPIVIDDGSFEVQTTHPLVLEANRPPYRYTSPFDATPQLAHIRILDRYGSTIYYEPRARGGTIRLQLRDDAGTSVDDITVTGNSERIQFTCRATRFTDHINHKPNSFRKHRNIHPGQGNRRFRVSRIEVVGTPIYFLKEASAHAGYFSEEYRILVWLDPDRVTR